MVRDSVDSRLAECFSVGTERYAMIAGRQSDAMDCFYMFCDSAGLSPGPQCWIPTPEQMLQCPQAIDEEMHMSIAQLVHMVHANEPTTVRMITETDAEWVVAAVSGWDDTADMSPFCLDHAQCTEYLVKAVVYHVHPLQGPANLRCGHCIAYFKHGHRWHLANDSQVDLLLMARVRGLPYIAVMERIHVLKEDVVAMHDEGEPTEIPVEIPAAPVSESATAHASVADSGTKSNAESQLQADRTPIPSFISGV